MCVQAKESLLGFGSLLSELKFLGRIFFWCNQKAKCFTIFFSVLAVVNVMRINHPLQIGTFLIGPPLQPLVNNDVMENNVENSIGKNTQANRHDIRVVTHHGAIIKQPDGGQAEHHSKPVIFFQSMIMNGVMGFMPHPQKAVHHILVCEPGHELPKEKGGDGDEGTPKNQYGHS
jgi:hypothetical protein